METNNTKLAQVAALLEEYQADHVSILLTLAHLQSLHNEQINSEGLSTANDKYQLGIKFFVDLMTITVR